MSEPSMGNLSRIGVLAILLIGASPLAAEPFGVATVPAAPDSRISAIWRDLQQAMRRMSRPSLHAVPIRPAALPRPFGSSR